MSPGRRRGYQLKHAAFPAISTTLGTGGEVSKNAVLSYVSPDGYKKSLRHDNFVPSAVILDGSLLTSAAADVTAACGMDALTQLLALFLSPTASALSDAIVWSGLQNLVPNLPRIYGEGSVDLQVRLSMAYGSLCCSGSPHELPGPNGIHPCKPGSIRWCSTQPQQFHCTHTIRNQDIA